MPTFTNQAQLSYNGITTNSNIARGEIVEVLSADKNSLSSVYSADGTQTYIISLVNSGNVAYTNLTVTDDLGAYSFTPSTGTAAVTLRPLTYTTGSIQYYQNGVLQASPSVSVTNGLVITGIGVPAAGNTLLIYQTSVNDFADLSSGGIITNTATVSGSELGSNLTVSHTITALSRPYLTIFKSVSPTQVAENGQLTYTFEIQNLGNTAALTTDNVQIQDTFDPTLSNLTVTYNGSVLSPDSYSYNALTGVFSTDAGVITVPAAVYTQNPVTGERTTTPATAVVTVSGNI